MHTTPSPDAAIWWQVYNMTLACGQSNTPEDFIDELMHQLPSLCRFDQATAYRIDERGKCAGKYLINISEKWSSLYLNYYSFLNNQEYGLINGNPDAFRSHPIRSHNWRKLDQSEFVTDYIRSRGVTYSCGFYLFDSRGNPRAIIGIERTGDQDFTQLELSRLQLAYPHLNNLYKNFFCTPTKPAVSRQVALKETDLTAREQEIVGLLCRGNSPADISRLLHISCSTVYRHVANIYRKLGISTRQELLVRFLA